MEEIKVQWRRYNGIDYDTIIPNSAGSCEWAENSGEAETATTAISGTYDEQGRQIDTSYLAFGGYLSLSQDGGTEKTFQISKQGLYSITIIEDGSTVGDKINRKNILFAIEDLNKSLENQATISITYNGTRTYTVGYLATSANYANQALLVKQTSGSKTWYVTCRAISVWG